MTQPTLKDAREVWSNIDDDTWDELLWVCTPYPCAPPEQEAAILIELHKRYNGSAGAAITEAMAEFDAAWKEHQERTKNQEST